jgi:tRNA pseudouridine55 synthase
MEAQEVHGLLVLDKPTGVTSRDAVNRAQQWFPRGTRIGHTGTLDPLATGVLVLCVGGATRLTEFIQDMGKTYRAGLLLGVRSDSDDADGVVTPVDHAPVPDLDTVRAGLQEFVGVIDQVPPAYSAAKVAGRRAYSMARRGLSVTLEPRKVRVDALDVLVFSYPHLEIEVRCGKGTYIRSLARDLGDKLACGAMVTSLRRTRVGQFLVNDAISLETTAAVARTRVLPLNMAVADLPVLKLTPERLRQLTLGQGVPNPGIQPQENQLYAVFAPNGVLCAVARWDPERLRFQPAKVFADLQLGSRLQASGPQ